jgi:hypothetical protein
MAEIPIACTLTVEEQVDRAAEWGRVRDRATRRETTATGVRLEFELDAAFARDLAELVVREVACCAFFTFNLTVDRDKLVLAVDVPDEAREIVAMLVA